VIARQLLAAVSVCFGTTILLAADSSIESNEGFATLFNGKSLEGWIVEGTKTYKDGDVEKPVWTVQDGLIHCAGKGFGFLRYDEKLSDFELRLEYRQKPNSNTGIGIRYEKFTGAVNTRPSRAGYEIQLLDDGHKPPDDHSTGSLYRYVAPKTSAAKPAGQWNEISIQCVGPKIKIVLNGQVVQDVDQREIKAIAKKPLEGYISVQNHGGVVDFRDIKLKNLD
jgi:hypothetical protein